MRTRFALVAGLAAVLLARAAHATWSIIIVDTRTGEVAIGSATCLTGFDLELNASVVLPGIGAAAAQSAVDTGGVNRVFIHDQLLRSTDPAQIITLLAGFDPSHQSRQYGIVDLRDNGRAATFTGSGAGQYRGGRTGRVIGGGPTGGDLVYAVQGNVLTGAPVIDAAVNAIEHAPGDLPEKLMRAMEGAMQQGGDGRCSCTPNNPTGCGSPPDGFTRSAYIGYMIISRAGDREGCNGLYRLNSSGPTAIVAADINHDAVPDLVTCNQASGNVSVLLNTIASGVATFSLPQLYPVGSSPRDIVTADFNGDSLPDIATANFSSLTVSVLRGQANGTLGGRRDFGTGNGPIALVAADFDHDGDIDLATADQLGPSISILVNDGTGAFTVAQTVLPPTIVFAIAAADLDDDNDPDLVIGAATSPANSLVVLRNETPDGGLVHFTVETPIDAGHAIGAIAVRDLNNDSRPDLVALAVSDSQINVLFQTDSGFAPPVPYTFAPQGIGLAIGDMDDDSLPDLVAASRSAPQRFGFLSGHADGTFSPARYFNFNLVPGRFAVADLDLDGDLDFAGTLFNNSDVITIRNFGHGEFNNGSGCAAGDYWINLNVANVPSGAPDPVPILRAQLDALRNDLLGLTDAVRSTASFEPARIRADGVNASDLTITLRDWQGAPVSAAPQRTVLVAPADGAGLGTTIGPVSLAPDGSYHAAVTSGAATGTATFLVTVMDGPAARPVTLMPGSQLVLLDRADWDLSGTVDSADFMAFLGDFLGAGADFDHNGVTDSRDFFEFLTAFFTF